MRRSDGVSSFEISAWDTPFVFRSDQPYDPLCTDEELQIVPRPGAKLAPISFRWREGAFALATDVAARARTAVDGLAPQAALDALEPWRKSLEAVGAYGDKHLAGLDEAFGAVVLLQAGAWEKLGRFDLAREALIVCGGRYPRVAAPCRQALRELDTRANPGLAFVDVKRLGTVPRSVSLTLPTDSPCEPVVFWAAEGLCVAQGTGRPFTTMRCHDPESGRWGKPVPVAWPARRYQCTEPGCFPCACAQADDRLDAPSDACRSVSFPRKQGAPARRFTPLAHTAGSSFFVADHEYFEVTDGALRPSSPDAVLAGAAASAGGSVIIASRFSCAEGVGGFAPGAVAVVCSDVRRPGTQFAVALQDVTPRPGAGSWSMRPVGSPDGRFVAFLFEPRDGVEADPVLLLARTMMVGKEPQ